MAKIITHKLHPLFFSVTQPPWIFSVTPLSTLFSTLADPALPPLQTPFALFAAAKFDLSSSDISRMLTKTPSLKNLKTLENVERVVHILVEHGCTQHQVGQIMMKQPAFLKFNAEKIVEPKIQLLKDYDIHGELLAKVLNRDSKVLGSNLERCLLPNLALLKDVFKSQDWLLKAINKQPSILAFNHERVLKPSLAFWEGYGFSGDELSKFLLCNPLLLSVSSITPAHLDLMRKIGIPQGSKMFKSILRIMCSSRVEKLEAKIQNLQRCGLSPEETLILLRVYPSTLSVSEEKIREKMDFIVNQMEFPANIVVKNSRLLGLSLEKTIKSRLLVVQKIKSMKGVENLKRRSLFTILSMTEPRFMRNIISEHTESSTLYALYQDAVANASDSKKIASKGSLFSRVGVVSEVEEH